MLFRVELLCPLSIRGVTTLPKNTMAAALILPQKTPLIRRMLGPDSFFAASCEIHDYQYSFDDNIPASESHRKEADDLFLKNMYREIEARVTNWFHKILRKAQAGIFHQLVRVFGKNHYKRGSKDASGTTD